MLKRIEYKNIGSFSDTSTLLNQFTRLDKKQIKRSNLESFCKDISRSFGESFNNKLLFLSTLKIISQKKIYITLNVDETVIQDTHKLKKHINDAFLEYINKQKIFFTLFPQKSIGYDAKSAMIYIKPSYLTLKYNYIKSFIISSGLLKSNLKSSFYEIEQPYYTKFEGIISNKSLSKKKRVKYSLDQLKNKLIKQEERGLKAEKFVLDFELNRLAGHPNLNKVKIISHLDTNAGYDIASYDSVDSIEVDRFIEVKSFYKSHGFYWTSNEIKIAKEKDENYFIYIVNSEKITFDNYFPEIYDNPFTTIFNSNIWKKEEKVFYLKKYEKTDPLLNI